MLEVALFLVSLGFAVTLGMLLFGNKRAGGPAIAPTRGHTPQLESESKARAQTEAELERKRRELEEQRSQVNELKAQLKDAKRKLFEAKDADKSDKDLLRARAEVERNASHQLEVVRIELAGALAEIDRLKALSSEGGRARRAPAPAAPTPAAAPVMSTPAEAPVAAPVAAETAEAPVAAPAPAPRRFRELSDADRERMERLEHTANKERSRAAELDANLKKTRSRADTQARLYTATKGELDLVKDKFKALEKRLNRTLLERDLVRRAIKDLEKRTGILAERTELTPDEIAASDRKSDEAASAAAAAAAAESERRAAMAQAEAPAESTPPAADEKNGTPAS